MKYVSRRVVRYADKLVLEYLSAMAKAMVSNPVPKTLSNGERLGCDGVFTIDLTYFVPGDEMAVKQTNSARFAWFEDTQCFDWVENHRKDLEICNPEESGS